MSFLNGRRNVDCENKSDDEIEESSPSPATTTSSSEEVDSDDDKKKSKKGEKDPQTLEEVLAAIKEAGRFYANILYQGLAVRPEQSF